MPGETDEALSQVNRQGLLAGADDPLPASGQPPAAPSLPEARWLAWARCWGPLVAAAALLLAQVARLYSPHLLVDDAFISFRYAANLAHGLGLVYNPGERVEGYSNFLWTVLLAAGARWGIDLVELSVALALAAALATLAVLWLWSRRLWSELEGGLLLAAMPPLLYAATGSQARYVVSGMETLLFGCALFAAVYLLQVRNRPLAAGVAFGLAAMTRPEGGMYWLLAAALTLWPGTGGTEAQAMRRRLRRALLLAAGCLVLYLPYFAWRWHYYGYLLPNTFYAKVGGSGWTRAERGLRLLKEAADWWSVYPLLAVAVAALPSLWSARPEVRRTVQLSTALVAITAVYFLYVGGDFLQLFGPRFLMPVLPLLLLLVGEGLCNLARWVARLVPGTGQQEAELVAARRRRSRVRSLLRSTTIVAAAAILMANALWRAWPARYFDAADQRWRMASWERLGRWIAAETPPKTVVAIGGAGIVPYYSQRKTIDMFGLTDLHIGHMTPLVIGFKQVAHEKYDPLYVLDRRPDLIISYIDRDGRLRTAGLPRVKDRIWACYRLLLLVKEWDAPPRDSPRLLPARRFIPELFDAGYTTAVLERRRGRGAQRCAALEGGPGVVDRLEP